VTRSTPVGAARVRWRWAALLACLCLGLAAAQERGEPPEIGPPPGLRAPTSPVYADAAWYDLVAVRWVEPDADRVWLEVELAAVDAAGTGPLGLRQPIVEVYVDVGGGGAATLLPGSGLRMPEGDGWRYAVRITGDGVWWWEAAVDGRGLLPPRSLPAVLDGRVVRIAWPTAAPGDARVYAISGVYDPFSPDGWRRLARTPSPWAFASEDGGPPVIDVLPGDAGVWQRVRDVRALVRDGDASGTGRGEASWYWWALMAAGLGLASGGLWWRSRPASEVPPAEAGAAAPTATPSGDDDALITDADLGGTGDDDGATATPDGTEPSWEAQPADAPQRVATPAATGSDASDAAAPADGDGDGSVRRTTDAPSDDSRSAKRS
jgi:hypothetical protein